MEHRSGLRKPSNEQVTLLRAGIPLGIFPLHNVSAGGLAVKGCVEKLPQNCLLTVRLLGAAATADATLEARALVVHQQQDLLGLMWIECDLMAALTAKAVHNSRSDAARPSW
jgi:citrate lyase beta subunit